MTVVFTESTMSRAGEYCGASKIFFIGARSRVGGLGWLGLRMIMTATGGFGNEQKGIGEVVVPPFC